jgi:type IV pilus assembly protein PilW
MIAQKSLQKGLTLIELMIALTLSLVLLAGVIQIFVANKASYRMTEAHARLQENARFALDILSRDVRSAGYSGCRTIENMNVVNIVADASTAVSSSTIITGREGKTGSTWVPNVSSTLTSANILPNTDTITIQSASSCGGSLTGNVTSSNAQIHITSPNSCNLNQGDIAMIADCEDAHIFRISNVPSSSSGKENLAHGIGSNHNQANHFCTSYTSLPQSGSCDTGTEKIYTYDAEIFLFRSYTYFIANGKNGDPALWRLNHNEAAGTSTNPVELIEGIENMQITFGVDTNDDDVVDSYITAEAVETANQWEQVISARISLLAQSLEDNLTVEDQVVAYNSGTITGTDGKIRRVFTTTVGVRNRVQ